MTVLSWIILGYLVMIGALLAAIWRWGHKKGGDR